MWCSDTLGVCGVWGQVVRLALQRPGLRGMQGLLQVGAGPGRGKGSRRHEKFLNRKYKNYKNKKGLGRHAKLLIYVDAEANNC